MHERNKESREFVEHDLKTGNFCRYLAPMSAHSYDAIGQQLV